MTKRQKRFMSAVRDMIKHTGEDPDREGLRDTPRRVLNSYDELFGGYGMAPIDVFKVFDAPCTGMVVLKEVEFYSTCEHHMLPFFGKAHIAYIPQGKVIGISKLARLLEIFSRRLQIQERIGDQITDALETHLKPEGCGCVLQAKHFCMTCRGVNKQESVMVTSSLRGAFLENQDVRNEFLRMIGL